MLMLMLIFFCPSDASLFPLSLTMQRDYYLEPWMHVLCTFGGAWAATKWVNVKYALLADVNEIRAYKGLPPMVGSRNYFPFVPPIELGKEE